MSDPRPELYRALGSLAVPPPEVRTSPLAGDANVDALVRHVLADSVERLIGHDAGVRLGIDEEELHQFRVAARRLRSQLRSFERVLDAEWCDVLRDELAWLGTAAGKARDLDVLGERMRQQVSLLTDEDAAAAGPMLVLLAEQSVAARGQLLEALRCHRYYSLLDALVAAANEPQLSNDSDSMTTTSARQFVKSAGRRQLRRLDRAINHAPDRPSDMELHRIRILAKRTRYAIDAARPIVGAAAARHATAVAQLQDTLGDLHDSVVAVQWLRQAFTARPSIGIAAGQILVAERHTQDLRRRHWRQDWHAANTDAMRAWL